MGLAISETVSWNKGTSNTHVGYLPEGVITEAHELSIMGIFLIFISYYIRLNDLELIPGGSLFIRD